MTRSLCFAAASFPPFSCGIGDYTSLLAERLATRLRVRVVTARRAEPCVAPPGVAVEQAFDWARLETGRQLAEAVAADPPDWLFLQYAPCSWGLKYAFDPVVPATLRRLRRRFPAMRVAVMFHEIEPPPLMDAWKRTLMWQWERARSGPGTGRRSGLRRD